LDLQTCGGDDYVGVEGLAGFESDAVGGHGLDGVSDDVGFASVESVEEVAPY
jgi:hypothetical protein